MMAASLNSAVCAVDYEQLERLKAMDQDAWSALVETLSGQLYKDILASLRSRRLPVQEAEDIQQKTWLTAVQRIADFTWSDDYGLYKWLRVISLKHIYNFNRKQSADFSFEEIDERSEEGGISLDAFLILNRLIEDSTEETVEVREQLAALAQALQSLDPRDREIFCRRYIYQEKPLDIARDYPMLKPRSVSQNLTRTRQKILALYDMMEQA